MDLLEISLWSFAIYLIYDISKDFMKKYYQEPHDKDAIAKINLIIVGLTTQYRVLVEENNLLKNQLNKFLNSDYESRLSDLEQKMAETTSSLDSDEMEI